MPKVLLSMGYVAALDDAKNAFIRTQNASIVALLAQYPTKTFKRIAQDLALVSAVKLKRGQNKWATYCANIAKQQRRKASDVMQDPSTQEAYRYARADAPESLACGNNPLNGQLVAVQPEVVLALQTSRTAQAKSGLKDVNAMGMKLHDATGLKFLILSVRGEPTDSLPRTIYASEKASTFFLGEGKADTFMKAFEKSCSGCKTRSMVGDEIAKVRAAISQMLVDNAKPFWSSKPLAKFPYSTWQTQADGRGLKLIGWPAGTRFCNPSQLKGDGSATKTRQLLKLLQDGSIAIIDKSDPRYDEEVDVCARAVETEQTP